MLKSGKERGMERGSGKMKQGKGKWGRSLGNGSCCINISKGPVLVLSIVNATSSHDDHLIRSLTSRNSPC